MYFINCPYPLLKPTVNNDYIPVGVQITFPTGSGPLTSLGDALDPIDDIRVEANENVQLTASITAGTGSFTPNGDTATVVIQDNDGRLHNNCLGKILFYFFPLQHSQLDLSQLRTKSVRRWVK